MADDTQTTKAKAIQDAFNQSTGIQSLKPRIENLAAQITGSPAVSINEAIARRLKHLADDQ